MDADGTFAELVEFARQDENVVGLVLTGSRGRGFAVSPESDWDVRLIVHDDVRDECHARFATPHGSRIRIVVLSLSEFERAGEVGSESAWDRCSYVHVEVPVDKAGIADLVAGKSRLEPELAHSLAAEYLDDYVNSYYRAAKNQRIGLAAEARLDAAESIPSLLSFLFAVNRRVTPFNRFLRWELDNHPLPGELWSADSLLPQLQAVLTTGDIGEQQRVFRDVEALARSHGLDDVIDGWEPDLGFLRGEASPRPT